MHFIPQVLSATMLPPAISLVIYVATFVHAALLVSTGQPTDEKCRKCGVNFSLDGNYHNCGTCRVYVRRSGNGKRKRQAASNRPLTAPADTDDDDANEL